jgi:hypothetical protein
MCWEDFNFSFNKATLKKIMAKEVLVGTCVLLGDGVHCGGRYCEPPQIM